jgi:hypothetical protein
VRRDLLDDLRSRTACRTGFDPGLAGGLRAWLEDGVVSIVSGMAGASALEIRPWNLVRGATGTYPGCPPTASANSPRRLPRLHLALVRTVFRLTVAGSPPARPFEDALSALSVEDRGVAIVHAVGALGRRQRSALRDIVRSDAATIVSQWRMPPAAWLPRTRERLCVPLGGGAVVLTATADLMLGALAPTCASVCAVNVHAGPPEAAHARVRGFLALLETLRSGAPPFRVATYHTACGRLVVQDVTDDVLTSAVSDVLEHLGTVRFARHEAAA